MKRQTNKFKIIFIFLISFILSGCTVNYDVIIKSDNSVIEKIDIFRATDELLEIYNEIEDAEKQDKGLKYFDTLKYDYEYRKRTGGLSILLSKNINALKELFEEALYSNLYSSYELIEMDDYISFKTVGDYTPAGIFTTENGEYGRNLVDKINLNVQFHNEVLSNNADKVDKKNNIYTWFISKEDDFKNIQFKIGSKKRHDVILKYFLKENILVISLLLILTIVPTVVLLTIKKNTKLINEI